VILLPPDRLDERRRAIRGPLAPLHSSLASELELLLASSPHIPSAKALLSRAGGRCPRDGATLTFDPWSPHSHVCPVCGEHYDGELHDRAWITFYQLWLAERVLHAALFHLLSGDRNYLAFAQTVVRALADRYLSYPNSDNVLGPTRLFFSTYLESIWLLQICVAASCLRDAGDDATAQIALDRIVEPSAALIAEYDEGMSNRQVWNNAALLAAAALCGDAASVDRRLHAESGLHAHLTRALLEDGTWYEGENYHQFALRGLWYGVALAEAMGHRLPDAIERRLRRAFIAPFRTALPDFTMPSRKDSQYAVSLRQWRIAETTELGFARYRDRTLGGALARLYHDHCERRPSNRSTSTADVERNGPGTALSRSDLGWRALVYALPELPKLVPTAERSTLLAHQGIAVFRRDGDVFAALDFGQSGGGHGHPDRLNVLLMHGTTRWLDDLGTGSYVDRSLHWYRSTLAHNAPLVNGHSQPICDGTLRAWDERDGLGWVAARLELKDVQLERRLIVAPDYLIDELRWESPRPVRLELPLHIDGTAPELTFAPATLDGGDGLEDGFGFVRDASSARVSAHRAVKIEATRDDDSLTTTLDCDQDVDLFLARAPGQPATELRRFFVARSTSAYGRMRCIHAWNTAVRAVQFSDDRIEVTCGVERHVHRGDAAGWHIELLANHARSSVDLAGWREEVVDTPPPAPAAPPSPRVLRRSPECSAWISDGHRASDGELTLELGEHEYRRSEHSWRDAGQPRATVRLCATRHALFICVAIRAGDLKFADPASDNIFDNEHPDTMAAGVQLYVRDAEGVGGWMLVPDSAQTLVRVRGLQGWGTWRHGDPKAAWRPFADGYELRIEVPLPVSKGEYPIDLDIIVNETIAARVRRRGQLVLSGARGEFVYLRGDRHDANRLIPIVIAG